MNRYMMLRRLTGPAILLLIGTLALLHEMGLHTWKFFFPLILILLGALKLAQHAALNTIAPYNDVPPMPPYPYAPPQQPYAAPTPQPQTTTIVPTSASTLFAADDKEKER